MTLGEQIKKARAKRGLTQASLARRSGVAVFTVQATERDRHMPNLKHIVALVRELRVPLEIDAGGGKVVTIKVGP
jgi:transcriptional regulator with XRE-family HTH domain